MSYIEARIPVHSSVPFQTVPVRVCTICGGVVHVGMLAVHDGWHGTSLPGRAVKLLQGAAGRVRAAVRPRPMGLDQWGNRG